jgi:hypothetical protein
LYRRWHSLDIAAWIVQNTRTMAAFVTAKISHKYSLIHFWTYGQMDIERETERMAEREKEKDAGMEIQTKRQKEKRMHIETR